jgi:hypothetical protein
VFWYSQSNNFLRQPGQIETGLPLYPITTSLHLPWKRRAKRRNPPDDRKGFDLKAPNASRRRLPTSPPHPLPSSPANSDPRTRQQAKSPSKPKIKCSLLRLPPPTPLRHILIAPPTRAPAFAPSSRWRAPTTPAPRPPGRSPSSAPGSGE